MAEQMSRDSFSVDDHGVFHHPLYGSRPAREMIWLTLLDAISNIRDRRANHPEQSVAMDRGLMRGAEAVLDTAQQGGLTVPQWTALIKQDKVPQQLADLCCHADMQPDERAFAFETLATLLDRLEFDRIAGAAGQHRQNPLTAALQQQFEASALITGGDLPCLLSLTADELLQFTANSSSSSSGNDAPWATQLLLAEYLQHVYFKLNRIWPAGRFTSDVAAVASVPVCELALAVARFTPHLFQPQQQQQQQGQPQGSREQGGQQQQQQQDSQQQQQQQRQHPAFLRGLLPLDKSLYAMHQALVARFQGRLEASIRAARPELHTFVMDLSDVELHQSPCYVPALGTLLVTYGYATLIQQHKTLPGLAKKSSSSSTGAAADGAPSTVGSSTPAVAAASAAAATAPSSSASGLGANSSSSSSRSAGPTAAAGGRKPGLKGGFFIKGGSSSSSGTSTKGSSTLAASPGSSSSATAAAGAGSSASVQQASSSSQSASQQQQAGSSSSQATSQQQQMGSSSQPQTMHELAEAMATVAVDWLPTSSQLPCQEVQQEATQAYHRMLRQHTRLPAAHQTLLQALDIDPRVAVWMGHYRRDTAKIGELLGMIAMVRNNVAFTAQHEQRKLRSQEHDARLQQQFRGLALFSLYWVAHHPFTTTLCLDCCDNAVVLARDVLQPWLLHIPAAPLQQQQQYSRQQVAQEALSCLPAVLTRLLAAMQLHLDSSASSGGGPSSSNGVCRQGSSSGGNSSIREATTLESTPDGVVFLCQLLGVLLGAAGAWVPQDFSTQQQQLERQLTAAAWAQHAAELTVQFEAFCRASAASTGVAALSKDVTQGAYLQLLSQPVARELGVSAIACVCVSAAGYKDVEGPLLQAAVTAGSGSREQRKLLGLLCSLLKYDALVVVPPHRDLNNVQVGELSVGVEAVDRWPVDKTAVVATCTKVLLLAAADSAADAAAGSGVAAAAARTTVASLPWLWLFGRCCVYWSCQQAASLRWKPATASNSLKHAFCHLREGRCILLQMQAALARWLSAGRVAEELTAAGYDLSPLQQQFAAAAAALHAAWDEAAGEQDVAEFWSELSRLGMMLCSTAAVKPICNNPACLTVTGQSETLLVSGRSCVCGACCIAHYCCHRCQRQHWPAHKQVCKALAAAAAGGSRNAAAAGT